MAENVSSILSSGGDYSTLAAWEADTDVALTASTHEVAEIGESETIEEGATSLTIAGATGFGTAQHRIIRSAGAAYDPALDTGPVVRFTHALSRIDAQGSEDYIELKDFCFFLDTTSNQTSQRHIIDTRGEGQITANVTVKRTTASVANTAGGRAIYCRGRNGVIASCYNCTVIGNGANTGLLIGILNNFDANIYNCVAYNCNEDGISSASVGEVVENCIAMDNGTDFSISTTVPSFNLSSDATATGTGSHASETTANIFTDAGSSDFSLVSGSNAHEGGTAQTVFTTDRNGLSRPQGSAWDMGTLELIPGQIVVPAIATGSTAPAVTRNRDVVVAAIASASVIIGIAADQELAVPVVATSSAVQPAVPTPSSGIVVILKRSTDGQTDITRMAPAHFAFEVWTGTAVGTGTIEEALISWDFGDPASGAENTDTGLIQNHFYQTDGVYTVTCTVVDRGGATGFATTDVTVNAQPTPDYDQYFAAAGNDISGDGTIGNPWQTQQKAAEEFNAHYNEAGKTVIRQHFNRGDVFVGSTTAWYMPEIISGALRECVLILEPYGSGAAPYFDWHTLAGGLVPLKLDSLNCDLRMSGLHFEGPYGYSGDTKLPWDNNLPDVEVAQVLCHPTNVIHNPNQDIPESKFDWVVQDCSSRRWNITFECRMWAMIAAGMDPVEEWPICLREMGFRNCDFQENYKYIFYGEQGRWISFRGCEFGKVYLSHVLRFTGIQQLSAVGSEFFDASMWKAGTNRLVWKLHSRPLTASGGQPCISRLIYGARNTYRGGGYCVDFGVSDAGALEQGWTDCMFEENTFLPALPEVTAQAVFPSISFTGVTQYLRLYAWNSWIRNNVFVGELETPFNFGSTCVYITTSMSASAPAPKHIEGVYIENNSYYARQTTRTDELILLSTTQASTGVRIRNNLVYGLGTNLNLIDTNPPSTAASSITECDNNSVLSGGANFADFMSLSAWQAANPTYDQNSLQLNPGFVSVDPLTVPNPDLLRITGASPVVSAGANIAVDNVMRDVDGDSRVAPFSMGADQIVAVTDTVSAPTIPSPSEVVAPTISQGPPIGAGLIAVPAVATASVALSPAKHVERTPAIAAASSAVPGLTLSGVTSPDGLTIVGLPLTLTTDNIDMVFSPDATNGVEITQVRDLSGASPFVYEVNLNQVSQGEEFDGRIWSIVVGDPSTGINTSDSAYPGTWYHVGPKDATVYQTFDLEVTAPVTRAIMFEWSGIVVPNAPEGDQLWVRIVAESGATTDKEIKFYGWCGRSGGESFTIEDFSYPCITVKGFATTRAAETHYEAQKRLKLMIPNQSRLNKSLPWPVMDLHSWKETGLPTEFTAKGPVKHLMTQFSAACSANSAVANEYLRCLIVGTRDAEGAYPKSIKHEILNFNDEGWYKMWTSSYPSFTSELAHGPMGDANVRQVTDTYNSCGPKYAHTVGVLQAQTQDWWYDVCENYRDWWKTTPGFQVSKTNTALSTYSKGPSILLFSWNSRKSDTDYTSRVRKVTTAIKQATDNAYVTPTRVIHFQSALTPNQGADVATPGVSDTYMPGLQSLIAELKSDGWKSAIYTQPLVASAVDPSVQSFISNPYRGSLPGIIKSNRDGDTGFNLSTSTTGIANMTFHPLEPLSNEFFEQMFPRIIGKLDVEALYLDAISGTGLDYYNGYRNPSSSSNRVRVWRPHGSPDYYRGVMRFITAFRAWLLEKYPATEFVLMTELLGEYGTFYDVGQNDQQHYFAQSQIVGSEVMLPSGLDNADHPLETRNPVPPIWECIHSQDRKGTKLTMWPTTSQLAGSPWHPEDLVGMEDAAWLNVQCFGPALNIINGRQAITPSHDWMLDDFPFEWNGSAIVSADVTGVRGVDLANFWKECVQSSQEAYGGQFFLFGEMQRPLVVDHSSVSVDTLSNPLTGLENINGIGLFTDPDSQFKTDSAGDRQAPPATFFLYPELAASIFRFENFDFPVPAVLHSTWLNIDEDAFGLVLVNWSDAAASWEGTWDPDIHPSWATYDVHQLVLGGAPTALATNQLASGGSRTIGDGSDFDIGQVPARTVWVLRIQAS